jgi:hypothetical protein
MAAMHSLTFKAASIDLVQHEVPQHRAVKVDRAHMQKLSVTEGKVDITSDMQIKFASTAHASNGMCAAMPSLPGVLFTFGGANFVW